MNDGFLTYEILLIRLIAEHVLIPASTPVASGQAVRASPTQGQVGRDLSSLARAAGGGPPEQDRRIPEEGKA